ncbi:MAG TPA: signal peptidase I [Thermoguttaceae bacterium]|nr:signal peptidase I [Thermoguttaceae bacterium]
MQAEAAIRAGSTPGSDNRRSPWIAVLLSFLCGGLGQVYCGRIARGLVLMLLSGGLGPVVAALVLMGPADWSTSAVLAAFVLPGLVWFYAVVDALVLAIRTGRNYQLKDYNRWFVYLILVLMLLPSSVAYALLTREGFFEAFQIVSASMEPTIAKNSRVLADKRAYRSEPVERGDVVVFINPNDRRERWIKRIVALPGDTIEIRGNQVLVNGKRLVRTEAGDARSEHGPVDGDVYWENNGPVRYKILLGPPDPNDPSVPEDLSETPIPPGHCFVLGDNRNTSCDSRQVGPIPLVDLAGRVDCIYFPAWRKIE